MDPLTTIKQYRVDPRLFNKHFFPQTQPWEAQWRIWESVIQNRRTAVKASMGVGKSHISAKIMLWFFYTYPGSLVLFSAPNFQLVEQVLWKEIKKLHQSIPFNTGANVYEVPLIKDTKNADHMLIGLTVQTKSKGDESLGSLFQGRHAKNLLIILDECSMLSREILEGALVMCTGGNNKILCIGNPLSNSGFFFDLFKTDGPDQPGGWAKHSISVYDTPNIIHQKDIYPELPTNQWLEDFIAMHGKDSPEYACKCMANFPDQSEYALIPLSKIEQAVTTRPEDIVDKEIQKIKVLGIDPSEGVGGDATVAYFLDGPKAIEVLYEKNIQVETVISRLDKVIRDNKVQRIGIERGGGFHMAIVEGLRNLKHSVTLVNFYGPPVTSSRDYADRKTEVAYSLKQRFENGTICIQKNDRLQRELSNLRREMILKGGFGVDKLEPKSEMSKRIGRSPDSCDALLVAQSMLSQPRFELYVS